MAKISKIVKDSRKPKFSTQHRNRCKCCGRPRGYMRKFELCRLCFPQVRPQWRAAGRPEVQLVRRGDHEYRSIADYLTRIRNGIMAGHDAVVVPSSKIRPVFAAS